MVFVALLLLAIGAIVMLIGAVMLLIEAFKENVWWGLGCLFVPPAAAVFMIMHWESAKRPTLVMFAGIAFITLASMLYQAAG